MSARTTLPAAAAVALGLLAWTCLRGIAGGAIQIDDAFFANVAKNVALGQGYSSALYGAHPFDIEITTGPLLILPAAVLIRWFGNQFWVPNFAYALCCGIALAGFLSLVRRRMPAGLRAPMGFMAAMTLLVFMSREFGLLGEIPAGLMVGAAALVLVPAGPVRVRHFAMAGLLVGLAANTKTVSVLALPAFTVALFLMPVSGRRWRGILAFAGALLLPGLAMLLWRTVALGTGLSLSTHPEVFSVVDRNGAMSGVRTLISAFSHPAQMVELAARHARSIAQWWNGWHWLSVPIGLTGGLLYATWRRRDDEVNRRLWFAAALLLGAAATHAIWWFALAPMGWLRHLLPGILYWSIAIGILASLTARIKPAWALLPMAVFLFSLPPVGRPPAPPFPIDTDDFAGPARELYRDVRWGPARTPRLSALLDTAAFVEDLTRDPNVLLLGCGWSHNPDVDFLLPGSANFRDCLRLTTAAVAGKRLVLVRSEFFNPEGNEALTRYRGICDRRILFLRGSFVVSECEGLPPF